ncbi:Lrp/AsnC ligand binding domain-containing protein [Promethearchaeum syntrophicum]|uniref:Lrp/AsnC ligand binding domain-containing protein n=1 Tax=Promethearchaeum syntrophicum TaxID=2594042 RepID=A0A5B9D9I3_9ARCH|nr:Lrp/AsnC ligand binding domain-containing protein [Candidatus Prometheoarchaeum syntrophicum]QEE15671.1 putative HTH-type transcriptional regulator [Candidatus Prometheoarchaeum syntrophicum]
MTVKIASFIKTEFGKSEFFGEELQKIPDITKILSISGEYEFLIEIRVEKSEELIDIIEYIEKIPGIKEVHSHYVLSEWEKKF